MFTFMMLFKNLIFSLTFIFVTIDCLPANFTNFELVYDRNVSLADLLAEKPSNQVRIWPIDPLQKVLLVGCLMILLLLIVLFGLYVALAILSPEQLDKLAFQPTNEDEMDLLNRGANICTLLTYYCYCCLICHVNTWMIMGAKKLADLFFDNAKS